MAAKYQWTVGYATLAIGRPTTEPPQLTEMLNRFENEGWEIVTVLAVAPSCGEMHPQARIVARKELK